MVEKVAIMTAGGSGIGAAAARALAVDGFRVAVLSPSGQGEALGKELGGIGITGSNQSDDGSRQACRTRRSTDGVASTRS